MPLNSYEISSANPLLMPFNRILIAINVRWWNAEAAYALNLAKGLRDQGCRVWMIVNPGSPVHHKAEACGLSVITDISLDAVSPFVHRRNYAKLLQVIDLHQIQLINSFKSNGSFLFSLVRRARPGLFYCKTRGEARPPRRNFMNRLLYGPKACDGLIAVGTPVRDWLKDLKLQQQRIDVIHYGDSGVSRIPVNERDVVRQELSINPDATVLTLLGRTQRVKGHHLLLEAMAALQDKLFHLLFLVKDLEEFPEELASLQGFISEHNLHEDVTVLGFQDDLARVLSITDLGVIPSLDSEVNCRVAVEFFSMGVPVMAFPTGSLPDIIRHGENGYLTRARSAGDLEKGIRWLTLEKDRLSELGANARQDYSRFYTLEKMTRNTLQFYQLCGQRENG